MRGSEFLDTNVPAHTGNARNPRWRDPARELIALRRRLLEGVNSPRATTADAAYLDRLRSGVTLPATLKRFS